MTIYKKLLQKITVYHSATMNIYLRIYDKLFPTCSIYIYVVYL